jgi:hypothetical protein
VRLCPFESRALRFDPLRLDPLSSIDRALAEIYAYSLSRTKVIYNHRMSDQTPDPAPNRKPDEPPEQTPDKATVGTPLSAREPVTDFHIGDEFGTTKRTLPPAGIVLICIAAVAVFIGIVAFTERPKPQGAGTIDFVSAVEVPDQNITLAAITLTLGNTARRPLWIKSLRAQLITAEGKTFDDEAASAVDLDRYFKAFPALKESTERPLSPETKLLPRTEQRGTIIVGFKVSRETFDQRKSLAVIVQPYDQVLPVILK